MDFNILNCSGDELSLLIILIAMKITRRVSIDDLNALAGIFSALAGLMFLEAKQQQRHLENQKNKTNQNCSVIYCRCINNKKRYRKNTEKK